MEKTAAREAYSRFLLQKNAEEDDPVSEGKLWGTGLAGGLFGFPGSAIAGAVNAPEGRGWSSAGAAGLGGVLGGIPGSALALYGLLRGNNIASAFGKPLGLLGAGAGGALGYYLRNRPDDDEEG